MSLNFILHLLLVTKQNSLVTSEPGVYCMLEQLCILLPLRLCRPAPCVQ